MTNWNPNTVNLQQWIEFSYQRKTSEVLWLTRVETNMFWSVIPAGELAVVGMAPMVSMGGSPISENGLKATWSLLNIVEALQMLTSQYKLFFISHWKIIFIIELIIIKLNYKVYPLSLFLSILLFFFSTVNLPHKSSLNILYRHSSLSLNFTFSRLNLISYN